MKKQLLKPPTVKAIKTLDVPLTSVALDALAEKLSKVTLVMPGEAVLTYNEAASQEKAWKKIKEDKRPDVEEKALAALFEHNTSGHQPVKTVAVQDSTGATCNVTMQDKYSDVDAIKVRSALALLGKTDPNVFVEEKLVVQFDTKAFYNAEGDLLSDYYQDMLAAIQDVAIKHGRPCPLAAGKVTAVKDDFGTLRWTEFSGEQQGQVSLLFPTTVTLTPVAPKKVQE